MKSLVIWQQYIGVDFFLFRVALLILAIRSLAYLEGAVYAKVKIGKRLTAHCQPFFLSTLGAVFLLDVCAMTRVTASPAAAYRFVCASAACLLLSALCAILAQILSAGGVRRALDSAIDRFLCVTEAIREWFEWLHSFFFRHAVIAWMLIGASLFLGFVGANGLERNAAAWWQLVFFFAAYCLYLARSLDSCRRLLLLLGVFSGLYVIQLEPLLRAILDKMSQIIEITEISEMITWAIILCCYVALWCMTGLIAHKEPARLVFQITNTLTTLLAVVGNIGMPYLAKLMPAGTSVDGYTIDTALMIAYNALLLPLVAAGYLAQITQDIYGYLTQKYNSNLSGTTDGRT